MAQNLLSNPDLLRQLQQMQQTLQQTEVLKSELSLQEQLTKQRMWTSEDFVPPINSQVCHVHRSLWSCYLEVVMLTDFVIQLLLKSSSFQTPPTHQPLGHLQYDIPSYAPASIPVPTTVIQQPVTNSVTCEPSLPTAPPGFMPIPMVNQAPALTSDTFTIDIEDSPLQEIVHDQEEVAPEREKEEHDRDDREREERLRSPARRRERSRSRSCSR